MPLKAERESRRDRCKYIKLGRKLYSYAPDCASDCANATIRISACTHIYLRARRHFAPTMKPHLRSALLSPFSSEPTSANFVFRTRRRLCTKPNPPAPQLAPWGTLDLRTPERTTRPTARTMGQRSTSAHRTHPHHSSASGTPRRRLPDAPTLAIFAESFGSHHPPGQFARRQTSSPVAPRWLNPVRPASRRCQPPLLRAVQSRFHRPR